MKCDVIKDLLPSYVDGLCSMESNKIIQEHLEQCNDCRKLYDQMRESDEKIKNVLPDKDDESEEQIHEIAIFRAMKKVVWHRVIGSVIGLTVALGVVIVFVFLIASQFHPEWEGPTVEHYLMKRTAKQAANDFRNGNMADCVKGIYNMYNSSGLSSSITIDKDVYDLYVNRMQKIYKSNPVVFDSPIDEISTGYISENDEQSCYSVSIRLKNELVLNFSFTTSEIYTIDICVPDGDNNSKIFDEFNSYLTMLSGAVSSEQLRIDKFYQTCYELQTGKIKSLSDHSIESLFSENCEYDYTNHIFNPSKRVKKWKKNMTAFLKENKICSFSSVKLPVDKKEQKEKRKLIWEIIDKNGNKGIFTKEFYYGMSGYEPIDENSIIYGNLCNSCRNKLEYIFQ